MKPSLSMPSAARPRANESSSSCVPNGMAPNHAENRVDSEDEVQRYRSASTTAESTRAASGD
jgi:hypothetical protein